MRQWDKIYKDNPNKYRYYSLLKPHEDMGKIIKIFKKHNMKRVLDLGCGSGRNILFLEKNGFEVYGIDLAKQGISSVKRKLKKKKHKPNLKVGNIFKKLPYKDDYFDAIICIQVIQHGRANQIKHAINEIKRILKPNGLLFITVCGRYSHGKVRYCLVKTAKKIASNTYIPTIGEEKGLVHYIFNKNTLKETFSGFKFIDLWKDSRDYYCLLASNI